MTDEKYLRIAVYGLLIACAILTPFVIYGLIMNVILWWSLP